MRVAATNELSDVFRKLSDVFGLIYTPPDTTLVVGAYGMRLNDQRHLIVYTRISKIMV